MVFLFRLTRRQAPDDELFVNRLNFNGYITIERDTALAQVKYDREIANSLLVQARDIMYHKSGLRYNTACRDSIIEYLKSYEGCPSHYFTTHKTQSDSIDSKKVLIPLFANGYAKDFLSLYMAHTSLSSKCNKIEKLLNRCDVEAGCNNRGEILVRIPCHAALQVNQRCAYHQEDVIAIPKEYNKYICADKDYILIFGDLAQADFRTAYNAYIRNEENAKIMDKCKDKYEGIARIVSATMGFEFNEEAFKAERDLYKRNVLQTINGTRNSIVPGEREFIQSFVKFLQTCERYCEMEERINDRLLLDLPIIVESYFGHKELATPNKARPIDTINFALNSPLQTTTAELVMHITNRILDQFYSLGYTEEDINVFYVRYDEPIFKAKKKVLKDAWIFEDMSTIYIDNWIPMNISFACGYNYKVPDEDLMKMYQNGIDNNKDKITILEPTTEEVPQFYPLTAAYSLYIQLQPVGDKTILTVYNNKLLKVDYLLLDTTDHQEACAVARDKILGAASKIMSHNYCGVIIYNNFFDYTVMQNGMLFKFVKKIDPSMSRVCVLSDYMATRYAKKVGANFDKPPLQRDASFIQGVTTLGLVF